MRGGSGVSLLFGTWVALLCQTTTLSQYGWWCCVTLPHATVGGSTVLDTIFPRLMCEGLSDSPMPRNRGCIPPD